MILHAQAQSGVVWEVMARLRCGPRVRGGGIEMAEESGERWRVQSASILGSAPSSRRRTVRTRRCRGAQIE